MNINAILKLIDAYQATHGTKDSAISRQTGLSTDLVRNWRRRQADGHGEAGINSQSEQATLAFLSREKFPVDRDATFPTRGFAEVNVEPWKPKQPDDVATLSRILAPNAEHPSTYQTNKSIPEFYFRKDDILIIDLKRAPQTGDIIIYNKMDPDTGSAETSIGRLIAPFVAPPDSAQEPQLIDSDIRIIGPIVASSRGGN